MRICVKQYRGLSGLLLLGAAASFAAAGCGDAFTSCRETHTCPRGGTGGSEGGAEAGGAGEASLAGSEAVGGSDAGGAGGDPAAPDGGGAPPVECGQGMRCAPAVPKGWDGPFSTDLTGSVPGCPPEFPELAYEGGSAPADEPATCGACQCENCTGGSCKQRVSYFTDTACEALAAAYTAAPNSCALQPADALSVRFDYEKDLSSISCDVKVGSTETTPPRWLDRVRLCSGKRQAGECAGGDVCVPALGEPESLCIVADGIKSCPAGYPDRRSVSSGFDDSRGCECECMGDVNCASASRPLVRFTCNATNMFTALNLDACVIIPPNQTFFTTDASTASPARVAKAVPVGEVAAARTISICCAP